MLQKFYIVAITLSLFSLNTNAQSKGKEVLIAMDLNVVTNDQLLVTVTPPAISSNEITYHVPKIIPGTYSEDDYGKYIENLKAYDAKGNTLVVAKMDDNSWKISNAKKLAKVTYYVNDTYDIEDTHDIFSPAGTNIEEGKNFMLNTHGFVGYFAGMKELPYKVSISHPATLWAATAMIDTDASDTKDVFVASRYPELVDNPIMYSKPDYTTFNISGMEIIIAVYSPNGLITAESITPHMKVMMTAQKNFLGKFNDTKKYAVLLYLSDLSKPDAQGFGALEHPTSTTVVMPEMMPKDQLAEQLKDVVSHEFFHIVTPLTIHSKEIHDFDYNNPKMSQHLWMYEGVTEYFANLFQVNQGLITEDDFYKRMAGKIANASRMNDTMPFTKMSAEVLQKPYKDQYLNVYDKGALIAMCLDIEIREKSNGQRGILDLMEKLSKEYGSKKAFDDSELFAKVTALTYPEIGQFLETYVAGPTPIPYDQYFAKMGVAKATIQVPGNIFVSGQAPVVSVNPTTKEIFFIPGSPSNDFTKALGIEGGDVLLAVNDVKYNLDNINDLIMLSMGLKTGEAISFTVKRGDQEKVLKGNVQIPMDAADGWQANDESKSALRQAWLKG